VAPWRVMRSGGAHVRSGHVWLGPAGGGVYARGEEVRVRECASCGEIVEARFRFCPWCAAPLRLKLVEFFRPHPLIAGDEHKALRVSRYLEPGPSAHVRFSIWTETDDAAEAEAAVSLERAEAARLAAFLARPTRARPRSSVRDRLESLLRQG
jgi:hypothetical protein